MLWKTMRTLLLSFVATMVLAVSATEYTQITLASSYPLYCLKTNGVLTRVQILSAGSIVEVPKKSIPELLPLESGERDTSGFYAGILAGQVSVPVRCERSRGLFITALLPIHDTNASIDPLPLIQNPKASYVSVYTSEGQVKTSDSIMAWAIGRNRKRFKSIWNRAYQPGQLSSEEILKSHKILGELQRFSDRTNPTAASLVYLPVATRANAHSLAEGLSKQTINQYGFSPAYGAWDVAVYGTATRLGFGHAPCAEFMSEVIRQAYVRAGLSHADDFNETIEEQLIFTPWQNDIFGPQSVRGLANRLALAGWIPWDPSVYRPMLGSIMMALDAWTPGHTYIIAGLDGRFIVDNGNPRGMDLRVSDLKLNRFRDMYGHGAFFLPPGITPSRW